MNTTSVQCSQRPEEGTGFPCGAEQSLSIPWPSSLYLPVGIIHVCYHHTLLRTFKFSLSSQKKGIKTYKNQELWGARQRGRWRKQEGGGNGNWEEM